MQNYQRIFDGNRAWAAAMLAQDPEYFKRHAEQQQPYALYIGCSDSRAPVNTMTGTEPGELFVTRNIANQVFPSDLSVLAVIQYAVEVLDVKHILVTGHYDCGGVKAALAAPRAGLVDNWLGSLRAIARLHHKELDALPDHQARVDRLAELNVMEQIHHLTLMPTILEAWARGRRPVLHGLVYDVGSGYLRELVSGIDSQAAVEEKLKASAFIF